MIKKNHIKYFLKIITKIITIFEICDNFHTVFSKIYTVFPYFICFFLKNRMNFFLQIIFKKTV